MTETFQSRIPTLSEAELRDEIATTVIHEIAHRFGIGEERLEELGWA